MISPARIGILLQPSLEGRRNGKKFFDFLSASLSSWIPEKYDNCEPIRRQFSPEQVEDALDLWMTGFLFARRRPRVQGHVLMGNRSRGIHDAVFLSAPPKSLANVDLGAFVADLHREWAVDLAYVHVDSDEDLEDPEYYDRCVAPFGQGLTTHELRKGLPSLAWALYLGKPYIDLFGTARLLSAPVAEKKEIDESLVYLQIMPDILDAVKNRPLFRETVAAAIDHLDPRTFVQPGRGKAERIPQFAWTG